VRPLPPTLLAIVEEDPGSGPVRVLIAITAEGRRYVPAFTNAEAVIEFTSSPQHVASAPLAAFAGVMEETATDLLIINPGSSDRQTVSLVEWRQLTAPGGRGPASR